MSPQLPDELWELVFEYLQLQIWPEDNEPNPRYVSKDEFKGVLALTRLCQVCRRFRRIAEPLIYKDLSDEHFERPHCMIPTLAENPRLAALVRKVDLGEWEVVDQDCLLRALNASEHALPISAKLKMQLRKIIESDYDGDDSHDRLRETYQVLVLALLPQVTYVEVTLVDEDTLLASAIQDALQQPEQPLGRDSQTPILSRLEELYIRFDVGYLFPLNMMQDAFHLPALKTLRGRKVSLNKPQAGSECLSQPSGLEHFFLESSRADADDIAWFLSQYYMCLRTLSIRWSCEVSDLNFSRIGEGLSRGQQQQQRQDQTTDDEELRLEVLVLDCRECDTYRESTPNWKGRIGSALVGMESLRHLAVPMDVLLGNEKERFPPHGVGARNDQLSLELTLPEGLETLHLLKCYAEHQEVVQREIRSVLTSSRLSSLRTVKVEDFPFLSSGFAETVPGFQMREEENERLIVFTRA